MKKCQLAKCKQPFTPTAPHQRFHSDKCRYKSAQLEKQRLVKIARKLQKTGQELGGARLGNKIHVAIDREKREN